MLDKLKKEIKSTLKEELDKHDYDEDGVRGGDAELDEWKKHQGWIEALEYVMGQIDHFSKEEYKSIQIPVGEEDIRMFQELVHYGRESFTWTFDKVNVEFIKDDGEDE